MNDLNNFFLLLLLFLNQNLEMFLIISTLFFSSFIFTSIINLSKHFYSARMVLRHQAQDKKTYEKRKNKIIQMLKELQKPLRLSFIGGGMNSSIGKIHFMASQLDKNFSIESGFFSRYKKTNIETQKQYNININRIYNSLDKLFG